MRQFIIVYLLCLSFTAIAQNEPDVQRIINQAIENKVKNDPRDVLASYTYDVYEKTVITDSLNGSTHNFFSEKVSQLQFTGDQQFSENIIGYQLAGFKNPRYEVFAVNVQSRSFYDDDFVIFNNRYAGILSNKRNAQL